MAKQAVATIGDKTQEVETSLGNATESYKTNSGSKFCLHYTIHAPAISWDRNWCWTKLGIEMLGQWASATFAQETKFVFLGFREVRGQGVCLVFLTFKFTPSSQCVLIKFSLRSHQISQIFNLFPQNAPNSTSLCSICFAQCGILGTYIGGQIY